MKEYKLVLLFFTGFTISAQQSSNLPTIYAIGGEGTNINWPAIKIEEEKDSNGPGFFYRDCSQGVTVSEASSKLTGNGSKSYGPSNLKDQNPMTAWVEGKSDYGIGEYFIIKSPDVNIVYNGYQSTPQNWKNNSRVKKFKVYYDNNPLCFLELTDEMGAQYFDLPVSKDYSFDNIHSFKFEIVDVYKGDKYADVAISEIDLVLCCFSTSTVIHTSSAPVSFKEIDSVKIIKTINLETNQLNDASILKVAKQIHSKLYKLTTVTKSIEITPNHPIYVNNYGFVSLAKLQTLLKIDKIENLPDELEILTWNAEKSSAEFEKLISLEAIEGRLETFTIIKLSGGPTYIANGFVTRIY